MRKIKLLLVAVLALVGLSAFAQAPGYGVQGYLYDAVGNKFINAEGKVGPEGMLFKTFDNSKKPTITSKGRTLDCYRFKLPDNSNGLGCNDKNVITTSTGTYGYGVFAVVPADKGFRIMSTYNYTDRKYQLLTDYCLGYKEDGTLCFFPEDEAPIWQLIDQETYDLLTTGLSTSVPANDAVGYLFAPSAMKFIAGDVENSGKKQAVTGITGIKLKAINDGGKYRFETELKQSEDSTEGGKNKGKATRLSRCEDQADNHITTTQYYGWSKWTVKAVDGQGFRLANGYGNAQGNCIAIDKDKTLTLVAEADAPCWIFVDQDAYDKLSAVLLEGPEPEPEAPKVFPETGAVGYLYNPAANLFITQNAKLGVKGDAVTIINEGTVDGGYYMRFEFSSGGRLNFSGSNGMSGSGTSFAKFTVKETEKGLLMTHSYPNSQGPNWMKDPDLTGTYMVANGEELGFMPLEEIGDYGYWQFVDEETYKTLIIPQFTTDEIYFLKNVESGLFFAGENNWGTRGTVSDRGDEFKLVKLAEGAYAIQNTLVSVNDKNLGSNIYVDNAGAAGGWTFDQVDKGVYTIFNTDAGGYLAQGTEQLVKGFGAVGVKEVTDAAKWYLLTKDEAIAQMSKATSEKPEPATFLIKNPGFNRNYSNAAWTMQASNQNLCGGTNDNKCAESWRSPFTLSQTMAVPNGKYILTAQAALTDYANAYDGKDYPVVYGNEVTAPFVNMEEGDRGTSMDKLSNSFAAGKYVVQPDTIYVVNGELTIGVKGTRTDTWCIWDNFTLTFYGPVDIATFKKLLEQAVAEAKATLNKEMYPAAKTDLQATIAEYDGAEYEGVKAYMDATDAVNAAIAAANASAGIYADYREALAAAREIFPETMPAGVLVALDKALKNYPESKVLTADATEESISEAATALWNAYNAAKAAVDSSKALMGMYELMENNNVVTPEAYDIYMDKFEEYSKQWKAGTLTEAVVNPYNLNGWHANLDYDDYLLSAWTIGGAQCVDYGTPLYINTWSTEGEGDGTNFKVPFFEYWTSDANSLGENELEATLADVEPGVYAVTAWVRVRAKNGTAAADATGITLQLNDGEAVDVTEGEAVGPFNLAEYTAEGNVEDGTLKIKFSVAGDNNISWLSFQNVKYEKTGDIATAISEVSSKTAAKSVFNVAGQQLAAPAKGLNIIDGKKVYVK